MKLCKKNRRQKLNLLTESLVVCVFWVSNYIRTVSLIISSNDLKFNKLKKILQPKSFPKNIKKKKRKANNNNRKKITEKKENYVKNYVMG